MFDSTDTGFTMNCHKVGFAWWRRVLELGSSNAYTTLFQLSLLLPFLPYSHRHQKPILECDQPNNKVYEFTGALDIGNTVRPSVAIHIYWVGRVALCRLFSLPRERLFSQPCVLFWLAPFTHGPVSTLSLEGLVSMSCTPSEQAHRCHEYPYLCSYACCPPLRHDEQTRTDPKSVSAPRTFCCAGVSSATRSTCMV